MSVPPRAPVVEGVNVTCATQLAPAASTLHALACAKSPLIVTPAIVTARAPLLVSATAIVPLVVPTICGTKVKLVEESATGPSTTPVPTTNVLGANVPAAEVATAAVAEAPAVSGVELKRKCLMRIAEPVGPVVRLPAVPARTTLMVRVVCGP